MKLFLVSFVLACGMAMVGCLIANAADEKAVRTLSKGAFSGISQAKQEVIKDQPTWEKFWAKHNVAMKPSAQLPKVDFSKEMVIAVTLGKKTSGGYSIEIMAVEPTASALKISVKRTSPAPGAIVITALTAPFHFVAVPKSDLKPQFVDAKDDGKK
jgi:hypothetical protein